jgi:hypothetical protein
VRRFSTPAWVVLPVWVGGELVWATVMDYVAPGSGGGGVAHWVHVFGFVFGMLIAWLVSLLGLERMLAPKSVREGDHAVLRAVERALARDRCGEAWTVLQGYVLRTPADHDAALTYWDLAKTLGRCRDAAPVLLRLIRAELMNGDDEEAIAHWTDLQAQTSAVTVEIDLAARLASALGHIGHTPEAADLVRDAVARVDVATPAAALVELLRAARFADADMAAAVTTRALAHPGLPPAVRRELVGGSTTDAGPFASCAGGGADSLGRSS